MPEPTPLTKYYESTVQEGQCGPDEAIGVITTSRVDRDGEVVIPGGGRLANYKRNPVVMYGHARGLPSEGKAGFPVAKNLWIKPTRDGMGLVARHLFDMDDEFSRKVCAKVKAEFLKCYSITFIPLSFGPPTKEEVKANPEWANAKTIYRDWELVEYSVVAMPSNVDAVTLAKAKAKRSHTVDDTTGSADPITREALAEQFPEAAAKIKAVADVAFIGKILSASTSKGVLLGDLRGAVLGSIVDRLTNALNSYLWSLVWSDMTNPADIPARIEEATEEFEEAATVAFEALESLRPTPEQVAARLSGQVGIMSRSMSEEARKLFGDPAEIFSAGAVSTVSKANAADDEPDPDDADEDEEDEEDEPIKKGMHVKCKAPHYKGYGRVESVHKGEMVPDVDEDIYGSKEEPAARVKCYKSVDGGHMPTKMYKAVLCKHCEKTAELKPPKKRVEKKDLDTGWTEAQKAAYKAIVVSSPAYKARAEAAAVEALAVVLGKV